MTYTVTFTDEEAEAVQHVVDFENRTTWHQPGTMTPEHWVRGEIVRRLGMATMRTWTSNNSEPLRVWRPGSAR